MLFIGRTLAVQLITTGVLLVFAKPAYRIYYSVHASHDSTTSISKTAKNETDPIQVDSQLLGLEVDEGKSPTKVIIPNISLDVSLRPSKVVEGKWEVFEDSGSYGLGSAIPGSIGNTVIFAHAKEGLFLPLKEIQIDERIYLFSSNEWFEYKVVEIKEVLPTDVSVIEPTTDETLTLFTCSGFADSKRLIVIAKRV